MTMLALALTGLQLATGPALADTIYVNVAYDGAAPSWAYDCPTAGCTWDVMKSRWNCGTLRRAVTCANLNAGADTIHFDHLYPTTYTLTILGVDDANRQGDLDITDDLTIVGRGNAITSIDASGLGAGGPTRTDRAIHVLPGATVSLVDLEILNGWDHSDDGVAGGGCVRNEGDLVLDSVIVSGCTAEGAYSYQGGGGLWNDSGASLYVIDSEINYNSSMDGWGGGIQSFGELTLEHSQVEYNQTETSGGGISAHADMVAFDTSIHSNTAQHVGGGIFLSNGGAASVFVHHSSITENNQSLAWTGLTLWRGGGGVAAHDASVASFENTTISSNLAAGLGGGVYTFDDYGANPLLDFSFCTVASNYATSHPAPDGLTCAAGGGGACHFEESIVDDRCWSGVTASGENLDSTATSSCGMFSLAGSAALGGLSLAGNDTWIHHLGVASDAIDASTPGACPDDDQEYDARGYVCDLGADER